MPTSSETTVRLGIVGCGAIANAHLLAAQRLSNVDVTALVDTNLTRANELAAEFQVGIVDDDYGNIYDEVDAVIIALPHHLHAPVTIDMLGHGLHVLVEKPMALSASACDDMIEAARDAGAHFAVGQLRRFLYSSQFVKRLIETGMLGQIQRFDVREGVVFNWPVTSKFTFQKETGGGVLADGGANTLDLLLWWLGGFESVEYFDDARGGVEADCELRLRLSCGAEGVVELSRTRDLRNSIILYGERGTIEIEARFDSEIRLRLEGEDAFLCGRAEADDRPREGAIELFERQLNNFVRTILGRDTMFITGSEGRRAVELIDACYGVRQPLINSWSSIGDMTGQGSGSTTSDSSENR